MKTLIVILTLIVLSACSPTENTQSPGIGDIQTITDMGIAID